jgi:hypothetical protein
MVDLMLAEARGLPHLTLRDVALVAPQRENALIGGARLDRLELRPLRDGVRLAADGNVLFEEPMPFSIALDYGNDDRLKGGARFLIANPRRRHPRAVRDRARWARQSGPSAPACCDSVIRRG